MFAIAALVGAQSAVTLTGTLKVFEPANDVFVRVWAGQPVTLTLAAPTIDPTLRVLDAVGEEVAFNDDHPGGFGLRSPRDAALQFTPDSDGLMVVRVASVNWIYSGDYTLTIEGAEVIDQSPVTILQNTSGGFVDGRLTAEPGRAPRQGFSFPALGGATVTLTLTSPAFDPVLEIYDAAGQLLASNDDHDAALFELPARTDAGLSFTVPEDGLYIALVRAFEDAGEGPFGLSIDGAAFGRATVIDSEAPGGGTCDRVLGGVVSASSTFGGNYAADNLLDGDSSTGWSSTSEDAAPALIFEVSSGATVALDGVVLNGFATAPGFEQDSVQEFEIGVATTLVDAADFTPVLRAQAPLENAMQSYPFDEPVLARYVLLRPLQNYGGSYFQAAEFNACTTLSGRSVGSLSGEPPFIISGQLRPDQDYVEYRLYARENASLDVTLTSEDFDPVVEIYDAQGRRLADNDDHLPQFRLPRLWDAALHVDLLEPGVVSVRVRGFSGGGAYMLTISGVQIQAQPPEAPRLAPCRDVSSQAVGGSIAAFSSEFGGRWLAAYLNDGSPETGWASAPGSQSERAEYVILDLAGDTHLLSGFRINPAATGGDGSAHNVSRFAVLVSTTTPDPEAFTEVFSTLLAERYRVTLGFEFAERVPARYVMLETRDTFGGRWHEVAEFTVCAAG
ncbi:MAG: hypothetical protein Kow0077_09230 [Anaerolineae bacterium]